MTFPALPPFHDYFEQQKELAEVAMSQGRGGTRTFDVAGLPWNFHYSDPRLAENLLRALDHLATSTLQKDGWEIWLWESDSSKIELKPPPWLLQSLLQCGEVQPYCRDGCYFHFIGYRRTLTLVDAQRRQAVVWLSSADGIPPYELASPLRTLFHAALVPSGVAHVHAAAVGTAGGGVLILGQSGAGKSSTAMACLKSPLLHAADDYCLVQGEPAHALSIYHTAKSRASDIGRLPVLNELDTLDFTLVTGKRLHFLHPRHSAHRSRGFPILAILIPRITGELDTHLAPASALAAMALLGPSTALAWPALGAQTFAILQKLIRNVSCYELAVGTLPEKIPEVIGALIQRLATRDHANT